MGYATEYPAFRINVAGAPEIAIYHPVPCGSGVNIDKITVTRAAGGTGWKFDLYSRYPVGTNLSLVRIEKNPSNAKAKIITAVRHDFKVGDRVTIANTGTAYDASHFVLEVIDNNTVVLETAWTADFSGDSDSVVKLDIPSTEFPNYHVGAQQTAATAGVVEYTPTNPIPYRNQEAQSNIGDKRLLYFKFDTAGVYTITLVTSSDMT